MISARSAVAAVVVIANRTAAPIRFESVLAYEGATASDAAAQVESPQQPPDKSKPIPSAAAHDAADPKHTPHQVLPEQLAVIATQDADGLDIHVTDLVPYRIKPWGVYYFGQNDQRRLELVEIGLGADLSKIVDPAKAVLPIPASSASANTFKSNSTAKSSVAAALSNLGNTSHARDETQTKLDSRRTISVAIYVDDDEATRKQVWEPRLKKRIAAASDILERHCGMKLAVDEVGRWESNNAINDFELSLGEFERKAKPLQARIAIGFTSQYQLTQGRTHLGGTRGPLASHILLREWSNHVSESERLELLVHELSHFLGAVHSPENRSVMRTLLGDKQARARDFTINIDPVNTLAMNIVAAEMRDAGVDSFAGLSAAAIARLTVIYSALQQALPEDPAAAQLLQMMRRRPQAIHKQ